MLADLSGADLAALVATIGAVVAAVVLTFASFRVIAQARRLRALMDRLTGEVADALVDLVDVAERADGELTRSGQLLDRAEDISSTLQDASKLTYLAVSSPVIKAAALASGVREGARRLRRTPDEVDGGLPSRSKRS